MAPTSCLSAMDDDLLSSNDSTIYRSNVGGLHYLTPTRHDLSLAINKVCQYLHARRTTHWSAIKHVLRYVQETISLRLAIKPYVSYRLSAYSNSDWAGNIDDR